MWNDLRSIIRESRRKNALSQTDLAIRIGKEQSYIYCVESGQIKISEEIVDEIAYALNIDLRRELYYRYKEEFEKISREDGNKNEFNQNRSAKERLDVMYSGEKKTKPTQLLVRPSTKVAIAEYAERNNTSTNDFLETLAVSYIKAINTGEIMCEYAGITFNPTANVYMKRGERKTERIQLLLKESTKKAIKEIAEKNGTSLNNVIHKLADSFLGEWYRQG